MQPLSGAAFSAAALCTTSPLTAEQQIYAEGIKEGMFLAGFHPQSSWGRWDPENDAWMKALDAYCRAHPGTPIPTAIWNFWK